MTEPETDYTTDLSSPDRTAAGQDSSSQPRASNTYENVTLPDQTGAQDPEEETP